ncbi:MAG: CBS domain-containing protein [Chloroflexi bacterium]|nr:CBS domain-containing protein [Chloroflexota bacterium]
MIHVRAIMTAGPITVQRQTPLDEVIGLMKTCSCRHLLVVDDDQLVGIVSDRDVRLAVASPIINHERLSNLHSLREILAEACMTPDPMTITSDAPAVEAATLMKRYKIDALPVIDDDQLVGIVTVSDILASYIELLKA